MKPERYRTTICGRRATRRIKWYQPKFLVDRDGKQYVNVFVVGWLNDDLKLELVAVTAQLGVDNRGYHVLPNNIVAPKSEFGGEQRTRLVIYNCGLQAGTLQDGGQALLDQINKTLNVPDQWFAPIGVDRGIIAPLTPCDDARINQVKEIQ